MAPKGETKSLFSFFSQAAFTLPSFSSFFSISDSFLLRRVTLREYFCTEELVEGTACVIGSKPSVLCEVDGTDELKHCFATFFPLSPPFRFFSGKSS